MYILDSNIIIYSLSPDYQLIRDFLVGKNLACSIISKIEVLGYSKLKQKEIEGFQIFFNKIPILPLSEEIAEGSIHLRQLRKITLGDSIIAATAKFHKAELITANADDFNWIEKLQVINPFFGTTKS